jgi:histidinol-phosphate aminotransferase
MDKKSEVGKTIRSEILKLKPYRSPHFECRIKLDLNENPFDLPQEVKEEVFQRVKPLLWQRYHDEFEEPLKKALADHLGHDPRGILIGNGSNELIFHSLLAAVSTGDSVVYSEPSFSLYRQNVLVLGGKPVAFKLGGDYFSVDSGEVIELARVSSARAVVLCSPNNPTGGSAPTEVIEEIVRSVSCLVVVDEAYGHFASDSALRLAGKYPNLVILRTFSKAFGLAGLRFGFGISSPELASEIAKVQLPHHVNFFTQLTALTLLRHPELLEEKVAAIKSGRKFLEKEMKLLPGLKVFPSQANFIMVELKRKSPAEIFNFLLSRGILVRDVSDYPCLDRCLRITIGSQPDNEAFLAAFREALA